MKTTRPLVAICLIAASPCLLQAGQIVPITAVTGSNGGDTYANGMVSINNGSGITKGDPLDPSTWTFSGSGYQDEWMAAYLKVGGAATPGLNGKLAWASLDFGAKKGLGTLYLFNNNYQAGVSGVAQYNLYYADSPTVPLPAQPNKNAFATTGLTPQGDYDFNSGGWNLFNTTGALTANKAAITTVDLPGVSARYLAVEILTNYGDTYQGGRVGFDEIAVTAAPPDSDADGLPDAYELAHTTPPSATSLDPGDDLEHGGLGDGLTNLQEYQLGTDPNNPDTDGDTLEDGSEVTGAGTRPPTKPLLADSDGDGLSDAVENNSGTFVSTANPGTSPINADTDGDGLNDNIESNTGIFVSAANPGTNPLNADSDNDGAGDWYEVAIIDKNPALGALPNSPNNASLKPDIPYPLPAPDGSSGVTNKPVKVYIMSGQSNMVGFGRFIGPEPGTLQTIVKTENKFPNLANGAAWTSRNDVKYRGVISAIGTGPLAPGFGANTNSFGPELGFGQVMGWSHAEPVLLIKASQGNRGLMWDILPPGSPRTVWTDGKTYPAYGESPQSWTTGVGPSPFVWYAGKQYDDFFLNESDMGASGWANATAYPANCQVRNNGVTYISKSAHTSAASSEPGVGLDSSTYWNVYSVFNTADILDNFAAEYPQWAAQGFEIAGFVWWQGYDDQGEPAATRYEPNLVGLIKRIRSYFENRYPTHTVHNAPFVLATLATGGWDLSGGGLKVANAQLAVDGAAGNYPEFVGNVKTMEARGFWRNFGPNTGQGYHYNHNAETYMLVGDALGRAMVELESAVTPPGNDYQNWAAAYPAKDLSDPAADLDGDGLSNNVERIFGLNPTFGSSANPITVPLNAGAGSFTYSRRNPSLTGLTFKVWTSPDLRNWTEDSTAVQTPGIPDANGVQSVAVALSPALLSQPKLFAQVRAAP